MEVISSSEEEFENDFELDLVGGPRKAGCPFDESKSVMENRMCAGFSMIMKVVVDHLGFGKDL